ncbi:MAG: hypothetical protein ACYTFI_26795 [Planctomycetota bacterium]
MLAAAVVASLFAGGGCSFNSPVDRTMFQSALMRTDARDAHRDLANEIGVASVVGGDSEAGGFGGCPT